MFINVRLFLFICLFSNIISLIVYFKIKLVSLNKITLIKLNTMHNVIKFMFVYGSFSVLMNEKKTNMNNSFVNKRT